MLFGKYWNKPKGLKEACQKSEIHMQELRTGCLLAQEKTKVLSFRHLFIRDLASFESSRTAASSIEVRRAYLLARKLIAHTKYGQGFLIPCCELQWK